MPTHGPRGNPHNLPGKPGYRPRGRRPLAAEEKREKEILTPSGRKNALIGRVAKRAVQVILDELEKPVRVAGAAARVAESGAGAAARGAARVGARGGAGAAARGAARVGARGVSRPPMPARRAPARRVRDTTTDPFERFAPITRTIKPRAGYGSSRKRK